MVISTRRMTVEAFDEWVFRPENRERNFEYIGGEIFEVVSHPRSSKLGARMITFLGIYLLKNDIGHLTGADGGYRVVGERYIPDVGFISYAKQLELLAVEGYNPAPPDLAIEVLSPTNDDDLMRVKVGNYLAAGTLTWVIDPEKQLVEVYRSGKPVEVLNIEGTLSGDDVLPGFTLAVKDIFPPTREN
jgi:Uma2 family endonuclease